MRYRIIFILLGYRHDIIMESFLLRLAPVDPRSLMQGDYMVLGYAFPRDANFKREMESATTRGRLLLELDDQGIGTFSRLRAEEGIPRDNEVWLKYRKWRRGFRFGHPPDRYER